MTNSDQQLNLIAEKVLDQAKIPKDEKFGSVMAILMVISIILTIIRVIQECNKTKTAEISTQDQPAFYTENIKLLSYKKGFFTRRRIKKIIAQKMNKEDYIKYAIPLTEAILKRGEEITENETITLINASNN